jgi:hypothetical protein
MSGLFFIFANTPHAAAGEGSFTAPFSAAQISSNAK